MTDALVTGNYYDKYAARGPLERRIMARFLTVFQKSLSFARNPDQVLEVGCGEGYLTRLMRDYFPPPVNILAVDIGFDALIRATDFNDSITYVQATAYHLPVCDNRFPLVVVPEVLEHLDDPETALREIIRVGSDMFVFSVPWEPVWRIGNLISGRYLHRLGNTPGHVQHWTRSGFRRFVSRHLTVTTVACPFPWTMIVARKH